MVFETLHKNGCENYAAIIIEYATILFIGTEQMVQVWGQKQILETS